MLLQRFFAPNRRYFENNDYLCTLEGTVTVCRWRRSQGGARGKSGQLGRSTSESRSSWRQLVREEENDRLLLLILSSGGGKGEKVCVRDHQPTGDRRAVPAGGCKFMYTID